MQKKILIIIAICCMMTGCDGRETTIEQENSKTDIVEMQISEVEEIADETGNVQEASVEIEEGTDREDEVSDPIVEDADWEAEMYDPVVEDTDWLDEMYDPWAEENTMEQKDEIIYKSEDYGKLQRYGSEFYYEEDVMGYYYNIEEFYLNSDFLYTMNDTLEDFYKRYLRQYQETENWYMEEGPQELPEGKVPYSELLFVGVEYVDLDYVSLLFNDVTYMGGARSYSKFDAVTIDRHTGKEVSATEILGESDEQVLEKVSNLMGMYEVADWEDIDFYLQKDKIVFFYRMPGYWEDVVLGR